MLWIIRQHDKHNKGANSEKSNAFYKKPNCLNLSRELAAHQTQNSSTQAPTPAAVAASIGTIASRRRRAAA